MHAPPSLTLGIEEEYLLVDRRSRDLAVDPPPDLLAECQQRLGAQVSSEFLRSQIEIGTKVCRSVAEAHDDLRRLRGIIAEVAGRYGLAPIAASTHPFAHWTEQKHTAKRRYDIIAADLAGASRRLLICGMHIHACIEEPDLRVDLMNQVVYFLPHLLALTTSSPFWGGEDMEMMSSRLLVFDSIPRSGLPDYFDSHAQYEGLVGQLVQAGVIDDASHIWWDIRPSCRFPTLEARITDVCTRVEDAVAVAALYQCLLHMLNRLREHNQRWRIYPHTLLRENRWLAQRDGTAGALIDFARGARLPFVTLLDELITQIMPDAEALHCTAAIEHLREIVARGTSAERQRRLYTEAVQAGVAREEALRRVVDFLIEETLAGC
jgi:carboxylate-amine ligase